MDFELLFTLLPKPSSTWTIADIQTWLDFIGLSQYGPQFKAASVDGSCLSDLTEDDIHYQLKISSKIITKKIITWIRQGIQRYDEFLANHERLKQTSLSKSMPPRSQVRSREGAMQRSYRMKEMDKWQQLYQLRESSAQRFGHHRQTAQLESQKPQINELIIKQCESSIFSCYSLKQQGGMIGRNSKNQIHVVDQNVSRFHAQIDFETAMYSIRDCGSSSGTFIRISEKTELRHVKDHIIQMGSNQFLIDLTNVKVLALKVIEGPNMGQTFTAQFPKGKSNVGRKTTNDISFPDDQHLSNMHSTIFSIQGIWYIEDLGTTNGTWVRLSPEGAKSQRYPLQNGMQFKLGSSLTFECHLKQNNRKTEKEKSDKCQFCRVAERDCIFLPCKHNVSCHICTQENQLTNCVSCGSQILEYMKIYKV